MQSKDWKPRHYIYPLPKPKHVDMPLTIQQWHALMLTADGHSNDEIAERLGITRAQVITVMGAVYRRLDARNRAHAVHRGHVLGLFTKAVWEAMRLPRTEV